MSKGDCYRAAANLIMDHTLPLPEDALMLAHGTVTSNEKLGPFGHAWVETEDYCFDFSNGKEVLMPVPEYYRRGGIVDVTYYTPQEARMKMLETRHYGPWN